MNTIVKRCFVVIALLVASTTRAADGVVIIGNANISRLDSSTLQKIYTGRVVEVNGIAVTAVNSTSGSALRNRFLQVYFNEDEYAYRAYWIKRNYAGLGAPPREMSGGGAVINYVKTTPGAIGYVDESELQPGVNVLMR